MKLLLDTHAFIWLLTDGRQLPKRIQQIVVDGSNEVYASAVNIFEIAARNSTGRRAGFSLGADDAILASRTANLRILDLKPEHAAVVETIANFHGDPFDRLLLAQAQVEGLQLVTHDEALARYDARTILF